MLVQLRSQNLTVPSACPVTAHHRIVTTGYMQPQPQDLVEGLLAGLT